MRQYLFLPFDHRASFEKGLLGIEGRTPTNSEVKNLQKFKQLIFDAVKLAIKKGAPKSEVAVLTDEGYGGAVLKEAKKLKITTSMPMEKSGQDVFDFDKGKNYRKQIEKISPDFVKVLVRYNPLNKEGNKIQRARLKELNDFLKKAKRKFLFELLVPATKEQGQKYGKAYDTIARPSLMIAAISEIQKEGIRPDLWKIEGVENKKDMENIVKQVQSVDKKAVVIVLGRGESEENVRKWLSAAAKVKGVEGFAVGRTVFMEPLKLFASKKISEKEAVGQIASNYLKLVSLWKGLKRRK